MYMAMRRIRRLPGTIVKIDDHCHQLLFMDKIPGYSFFDLRYGSLVSVNHGHTCRVLKSASRYAYLPIP